MDNRELMPLFSLQEQYRYGLPQRSGALTVVPVFGAERDGRFPGPQSGLKLSQVRGYGNMELLNPAESGIAIVPLHMGYIQDKAQNHALCSAALLAAGQKRMFEDACCVQASQGGYLEGREQWFFILPLPLRMAALQLRGRDSYSKLWGAITELNETFGLPERGHLEQIVSRSRYLLMQYQNRFELLPGQIGAIFFLGYRLAGIEIAPSADYFREVWPALVCYSYGTAALRMEKNRGSAEALPEPFAATSLAGLRSELLHSRAAFEDEVRHWIELTPPEKFERKEEERLLDLQLHTLIGARFAGQVVEDAGGVVYASIFARPEYILQR